METKLSLKYIWDRGDDFFYKMHATRDEGIKKKTYSILDWRSIYRVDININFPNLGLYRTIKVIIKRSNKQR